MQVCLRLNFRARRIESYDSLGGADAAILEVALRVAEELTTVTGVRDNIKNVCRPRFPHELAREQKVPGAGEEARDKVGLPMCVLNQRCLQWHAAPT